MQTVWNPLSAGGRRGDVKVSYVPRHMHEALHTSLLIATRPTESPGRLIRQSCDVSSVHEFVITDAGPSGQTKPQAISGVMARQLLAVGNDARSGFSR